MNYFERELRKIVGHCEYIRNPKYVGRACVGRLDDDIVVIAPPTKPCRQILGIKKISQRQKNLKCGTIPAFFFLDKFPFYFRLFGKV